MFGYLYGSPVMCHHHPDVLHAHEDRDDHPEDKQAAVPQVRSKYQHQSTADPKEGIKDSILDDGSNADILITLEFEIIIKCPNSSEVSDDVEDGCNDGDNQLTNSNNQN